MFSVNVLLVFMVSVSLFFKARCQDDFCRGCANDTNCHLFGGPTNSKYVGCHGTFDNENGPSMTTLCSPGFIVPNMTEAVNEGFDKAMCDTVVADEFFMFFETADGRRCNSEFQESLNDGVYYVGGIFGCGNETATFSDAVETNGECEVNGVEPTTLYLNGDVADVIGPSSGSVDFENVQVLDANFAGVICIRLPTMAPTNMPTNAPTAPTLNPSGVPSRTPTDLPSKDPTYTPTRNPTLTMFPTNLPTTIPSRMPSDEPSSIPSDMPTYDPTATPTLSPTDAPNTKKEPLESPIPGLPMNLFLIFCGGLGALVFCFLFLFGCKKWGICKDKNDEIKKNSTSLGMMAPQTNQQQQQTVKTTSGSTMDADFKGFHISNIQKTRQ